MTAVLIVIDLTLDENAIQSLIRHKNEIQNKWSNELNLREDKISKEISRHKDIVLIDSIDIYRNLPEKLLQSIR